MQDNNEAGASPARGYRLVELEQWANDLPRRLAGGSDRGITRWAVTEIERLRTEVATTEGTEMRWAVELDRRADEITELGSKVVALHRELSDVLGEVRALLDGPIMSRGAAAHRLRERLGR
jgi:hypothetical protein